MPIGFDKRNKRWRYYFDRFIEGKRQRASRLLPKGWTRTQADAYDQAQTGKLYAIATGVIKPAHLIEDAVLLYLEQHAPRLKNSWNMERELATCYEAYAGRPMEDLPAVAREYAALNAETLAPATVRNRMAYLRAACRWAWKYHGMGEHDPAERLVMPPVNNQRHVYFNREQFISICRLVVKSVDRAAMRVAFYSGMRISEVCRATVSLDGSTFVLDDTKNGLPRMVPIHPKVAHITRNKKLWPIKHRSWAVSKSFKKSAILAGYPEARLHDLRHSTASEMINGGADLYTVGGVLGHKSAASTQRYSHLATQTLANALALVGKKSHTKPKEKAA